MVMLFYTKTNFSGKTEVSQIAVKRMRQPLTCKLKIWTKFFIWIQSRFTKWQEKIKNPTNQKSRLKVYRKLHNQVYSLLKICINLSDHRGKHRGWYVFFFKDFKCVLWIHCHLCQYYFHLYFIYKFLCPMVLNSFSSGFQVFLTNDRILYGTCKELGTWWLLFSCLVLSTDFKSRSLDRLVPSSAKRNVQYRLNCDGVVCRTSFLNPSLPLKSQGEGEW